MRGTDRRRSYLGILIPKKIEMEWIPLPIGLT
jgi:hypothetical protein